MSKVNFVVGPVVIGKSSEKTRIVRSNEDQNQKTLWDHLFQHSALKSKRRREGMSRVKKSSLWDHLL